VIPNPHEAQAHRIISKNISNQGKNNVPEFNGVQAIKKYTAELNESVHMNPSGLGVAPSHSYLESGLHQTSKQD